ncbi:hypothetical protein Agub_g14929, partial [Astrephomene gubernaculifera]
QQQQGQPLEWVRVFVQEYRRGGQGGGGGGGGGEAEYTRNFVVSTYKVVWRRFQKLPATQRHFYEIIRSDRPCHMYFDLEYSRGANPGVDGDGMVYEVVRLLGRLMSETW